MKKTKMLCALLTVSLCASTACETTKEETSSTTTTNATVASTTDVPVSETETSCSSDTKALETEVTTTTETTIKEIPLDEKSINKLSMGELKTLTDNGTTFFLYVKGASAFEFEYEDIETALQSILKDYEFPFSMVEIDEDEIKTADDSSALKALLGEPANVVDIKNAGLEEGQEPLKEDMGQTYHGFYMFKEGKTVEKNNNIEQKLTSMRSAALMVIYNSEVFFDDHGFDVLTYEDIKKKRENGDTFLIYVGRDSCNYCHVFQELLGEAFSEHQPTVPFFYFPSHQYKKAIDKGYDNAQETWEAIQKDLHFEKNASLIYIVNGECVDTFRFDNYFSGSFYVFADEEGRKEMRKAGMDALMQFLQEKELIKE